MARKPADQSVNREDIIVAAADVLYRNGYEATTMKDIAAEVNLTAASLYHHFRNKDTLLLAVLEGGLEVVIEQIEPVANSNKTNVEKLTEMIRLHIYYVTQNTAVGAAMVFEIRPLLNFRVPPRNGNQFGGSDYDEFLDRRDRFFKRRAYFEELFVRVIEDGVKKGEFRQVDPKIFTKTMVGANNWVAVWYKEGGRLSGDQVARMIAENFVWSLQPYRSASLP
ncbi:MAG: TetR/AcrR family transcriptional regulator [Phototrophicales bacterium]